MLFKAPTPLPSLTTVDHLSVWTGPPTQFSVQSPASWLPLFVGLRGGGRQHSSSETLNCLSQVRLEPFLYIYRATKYRGGDTVPTVARSQGPQHSTADVYHAAQSLAAC